jgi:hypothetical protein
MLQLEQKKISHLLHLLLPCVFIGCSLLGLIDAFPYLFADVFESFYGNA